MIWRATDYVDDEVKETSYDDEDDDNVRIIINPDGDDPGNIPGEVSGFNPFKSAARFVARTAARVTELPVDAALWAGKTAVNTALHPLAYAVNKLKPGGGGGGGGGGDGGDGGGDGGGGDGGDGGAPPDGGDGG